MVHPVYRTTPTDGLVSLQVHAHGSKTDVAVRNGRPDLLRRGLQAHLSPTCAIASVTASSCSSRSSKDRCRAWSLASQASGDSEPLNPPPALVHRVAAEMRQNTDLHSIKPRCRYRTRQVKCLHHCRLRKQNNHKKLCDISILYGDNKTLQKPPAVANL